MRHGLSNLWPATALLALFAAMATVGCQANDDVPGEATQQWLRQQEQRPGTGPPGPSRLPGTSQIRPHPAPPQPANANDPPSPVPSQSDAHMDEWIDTQYPESEGPVPDRP